MRAGELDRRVRIERRTSVRNSLNEEVEGWAPVATVWARFEPLGGDETFQAREHTAKARARFTIRYRAGLDATMRMLYDGEVWNIESIDEPNRRRELVITAFTRGAVTGGS